MARPQSMTQLKAPTSTKLGSYRIMHQGRYHWYKANSKDDALSMFRLELADLDGWRIKYERLVCYLHFLSCPHLACQLNDFFANDETLSRTWLDKVIDNETLAKVVLLDPPKKFAELVPNTYPLPLKAEITGHNPDVTPDPLPTHWTIEIFDYANSLEWADLLLRDLEQFILKQKAKHHDDVTTPTGQANTIRQVVDMFIDKQRVRVNAKLAGNKGISASRYAIIQRYLNFFADWYGVRKSAETITELTVETYNTHLINQTTLPKNEGRWSSETAGIAWDCFRQFILWSWKLRILKGDLPRNLDNTEYMFTKKTQQIVVWDTTEVSTLLANIPKRSERLRLYCLLMLNTGMTQQDVSDLEPHQVDWDKRTITRKRSKTKEWENVPTVTYPIWDSTFDLLSKYGKREGERVLLNEDGKPLITSVLVTKSGTTKRKAIDNIGLAFHRLRRKLAAKGTLVTTKSLKGFRKTSHSHIGNSKDFSRFKVYFLGQSNRTVADKSYFALDNTEFAKAVTWLATVYGLK